MSEYLPQLINPDGLYDPTPNGYSHIAIAPPEAKIIYIITTYFATRRRAIGSNWDKYLHV